MLMADFVDAFFPEASRKALTQQQVLKVIPVSLARSRYYPEHAYSRDWLHKSSQVRTLKKEGMLTSRFKAIASYT